MFLNYFALGVLIAVFLILFYGVIIIHDIPYLLAKNAGTRIKMRFTLPVGSACLRCTPFGRCCGSGQRSIGRNAAGA